MKFEIGTRVTRKRDGATGTVTERQLVVPSVAHPGIYGKTTVTIRLDDEALRAKAGGDMTGDLGWANSNFKKEKI